MVSEFKGVITIVFIINGFTYVICKYIYIFTFILCVMKKSEYKWCNGLTEAAGILQVPVVLIRRAKRHPAFIDCFKQNGRCSPDLIKPLLDQYRGELEADDHTDSLEYWKKRKLKADAYMSEIELDETRKKYLDKEEVIAFLRQIATAQRALLKSKLVNELPPKLLGLDSTAMTVILNKELNDILNIFQSGIDKWN